MKLPLTLIIVASAAILTVGCLMQPRDAVTGKPFGTPYSAVTDTQPAESPDGNPVTSTPTNKPDVDGALTVVRDNGGKFGAIGGALAGIAGTLLVLRRQRPATAVAEAKGSNANG